MDSPDGSFHLQQSELNPESRVFMRNEIGKMDDDPINCDIEYRQKIYVFTGKLKGHVYIFRTDGLDGYQLVSQDLWSGDPLTSALK